MPGAEKRDPGLRPVAVAPGRKRAPGALVWALGTMAVLAGGGCAEMGGNSFVSSYGGYRSPQRVVVAPAPPRPTVAQSALPKVDRGTTGAEYGREMASIRKWTAAEREARIRQYLRDHPESGYRKAREETLARLQVFKAKLSRFQDDQDILGERDFARDYERRLREAIAKEEAELARIDNLIVDAILGDEAAAAVEFGAPTAEERGRMGRAGENAGRAAGESRRRADEAFRRAGW